MRKEELYRNQFIRSIIDLLFPILKRCQLQKYDKLSHYEKYLVDISRYNNNLLNALTEIESVIVFLKRFYQKKFYQGNNINEIDYIKYHMEVYYHKLFTISELLKLLINRIYQLELPERKCSTENLIKKLGENDPVIILLKDFEKTLSYYRKKRIKSAHYGNFIPDKDYDDLLSCNDFHFIVESLDIELKEGDIPKSVVDYMTRKYRKEQIVKLTNDLSGIRQYIDLFYKIWIGAFTKNLEEISCISVNPNML